jgi:hypothetical protein
VYKNHSYNHEVAAAFPSAAHDPPKMWDEDLWLIISGFQRFKTARQRAPGSIQHA